MSNPSADPQERPTAPTVDELQGFLSWLASSGWIREADDERALRWLSAQIPGLLADSEDKARGDIAPDTVERWMVNHGFFAIESGARCAVTLYDEDGDAGLRFERSSLADACALADRFLNEVPCVDDVGYEKCVRECTRWIKENDPSNDSIAQPGASPSASAPTGDA